MVVQKVILDRAQEETDDHVLGIFDLENLNEKGFPHYTLKYYTRLEDLAKELVNFSPHPILIDPISGRFESTSLLSYPRLLDPKSGSLGYASGRYMYVLSGLDRIKLVIKSMIDQLPDYTEILTVYDLEKIGDMLTWKDREHMKRVCKRWSVMVQIKNRSCLVCGISVESLGQEITKVKPYCDSHYCQLCRSNVITLPCYKYPIGLNTNRQRNRKVTDHFQKGLCIFRVKHLGLCKRPRHTYQKFCETHTCEMQGCWRPVAKSQTHKLHIFNKCSGHLHCYGNDKLTLNS